VWQYLAVLCSGLVLYAVSCAPGALWQDSGLIQYRIWHNDIEGFLGLAISHPLFYILAIGAKSVPLGEFGYRVNLVSAVAAAVAVANLFLFVRLWLGRNFPAVIAAATLALSHTFWAHASIIETYTLWAALFFAELIMLLQYTKTSRVGYLYWLGLLNGLAIADHMLASMPLLCYSIFLIVLLLRNQIRLRHLGIIALCWIIGALPYEYLIIKNIIQTKDIVGTLASAAFGNSWQGAVLNTSLSARIIKEDLLFILLNFPTPNIALFFVGCFAIFRFSMSRALRNVLLGVTILFFVFAFRYTVPDRYAFFIPFYCAVSVFIGLGTHLFQRHRSGRVFGLLVLVFSLLPVGVYTAAPALAEKMQFNIGTRSDIPYRDDYKYFLQPWRTGDKGAERFAEEALETKEKDSVIYADLTTVGPLLYVQEVKGKRPDVKIVSSVIRSENSPGFDEQTIEQLLKERAIYVVSRRPRYCPAFVLDNYDLVPAGVLWRVVERGEKGSIEQRRQENMHTGKFGRIVFVFDEIQKETTLVSRYWAYRVGRYG
jgi:hypothetical protein